MSADPNWKNLGCAIMKKMVIWINRNKLMSIDDSDVYHCYLDLWKTHLERTNGHCQGLSDAVGQDETKLYVGASQMQK